MATSIINPAQTLGPAASATSTSTSQMASSSGSNSLTSEDAFLKLLVAQIQHQDPLNPSDGVQFLTQLTSFSQLEQLIQINQELAPQPAPGNNSASNSTVNPTG
jgi:flagellar basal-body rod modification protein FlgD